MGRNRVFPLHRLFLAVVLSLPMAGFLDAARAQGVAAKATVSVADSAVLRELRRQLAALEQRIVELEKGEAQNVEDPDEAIAAEKRLRILEQRLSKVEQSTSEPGAARAAKDSGDDGEESISVRVPFVVHDKAGRTIFRIDTVDDDRPLVVVGNPLGASAVLGIDAEGSGSLRLFGQDRHARVLLAAKSEGGNLVLENSGKKNAVTLGVKNDGTGILKVMNAGGTGVAAITGDANGGRVVVANARTGLNAVALSTSAEGGMVNVYATEGGPPRSNLLADGKSGSVNIMNSSGVAVALLESGSARGAGRLMLANEGGDIVVEAGTLPGGFGIVRTGPAGAGPAGVVGATVRQASSIQGKK